jgi:MHS family shikimate/dehydroshikimate transporter-like MFS transporter
VAVTVFPSEQYQVPRSWTERAYPKLIYYNKVDKGGHFAAWEQQVLVMPLAGWLSDVIGRRTIYLAGTGFGIVLAFPIFWLFETRDATIVTWAIVVGISLCQGVVFALHASFMPELFGTDARYSGVSLGFQVGAAIGGGLTPVIAAATDA